MVQYASDQVTNRAVCIQSMKQGYYETEAALGSVMGDVLSA